MVVCAVSGQFASELMYDGDRLYAADALAHQYFCRTGFGGSRQP